MISNRLILPAGLLVFFFTLPVRAAEYRIDSQEAFDRLKNKTYQPGDVILFKRGRRFTGMFNPKGNGSRGRPIVVDAYGQGDLPAIDAGGAHRAGLMLKSPSFWEINRLEITNTNGKDEDQGNLFGIYVLASDREGVFEHVYVHGCHIRDVNGKVAGKRRGGIHIHIKNLKRSRFHDLRITGNRLTRIGGVGIGNDSSCGKVIVGKDGKARTRNLWTRVYVADNHVDRTGRNGIIARVSKDAIYERNTLANNSRFSTGHSMFNFNTDGIKVQYNEAYGNVGEGGKDRGGFDADYNSIDTHIQYNYSHDNLWFCGIMKKPNHRVIIRHNVSQNDREGIYFFGFEHKKQASNIQIYNNTHFVRKGLNVIVFAENRTPLNTTLKRNIFFFEGKGRWGRNARGINTRFNNNVYCNIPPHPSDNQARTEDPLFVNPGKAASNIDLKTMQALSGYRLHPDSPYFKPPGGSSGKQDSQRQPYGATMPGWTMPEDRP